MSAAALEILTTSTASNTSDKNSHTVAKFTSNNYNDNYLNDTDNPETTSELLFISIIASDAAIMVTNAGGLQTDSRDLQTFASKLETDITALQTNGDTQQYDISTGTLQSFVSRPILQTDINTPMTDGKTDVSVLCTDINDAQTDTNTIQINDITSKVNTNILQTGRLQVDTSAQTTDTSVLKTAESQQGTRVIVMTDEINSTFNVPSYTKNPTTKPSGEIRIHHDYNQGAHINYS